MTVAEVSAVGLPAVYVPLPHGNGEQALNAGPVVATGGGLLVPDAECDGPRVLAELVPMLTDPERLATMGAAARGSGHAGADEALARSSFEVAARRERRRQTQRPRTSTDRVHLIGIGGAGMNGIARIMLARGLTVSGSDAKDSRAVLALRALAPGRRRARRGAPAVGAGDGGRVQRDPRDQPRAGRRPRAGPARGAPGPGAGRADGGPAAGLRRRHARQDLHHVDADGGPAALRPRSVLRDRWRPGPPVRARTTAAARCSWPRPTRATARSSRSPPWVAVVTNVEADHLDHHGTAAAYAAAFATSSAASSPAARWSPAPTTPERRAGRRRRGGRDPGLRYGRQRRAPTPLLLDYRPDGAGVRGCCCATPGSSTAWPRRAGRAHGAERARCAARRCGAGRAVHGLLDGLAVFSGVRRRFEFKGRAAGVAVYDDYAHHPTEVAAQLRAARDVPPGGRLIVAFQPHLYSRTRDFAARVRQGARARRRGRGAGGLRRPRGPRARGERWAGRRRGAAAARAGALRAALGGRAGRGRRDWPGRATS